MQRWDQHQISEELDASSLTHAQLITSHWVAGQERGGEMVMRQRERGRERWKSGRAKKQLGMERE